MKKRSPPLIWLLECWIKSRVFRRSHVFNNPIKYSDPLGLDTFMCAAPLYALGKYGPKVYNPSWYNPLYHQFICVNDSSGNDPTCGSQDRSGRALWSNGKPGNDRWPKAGEGSCRKVDTRKCVDECSKREILNPKRPRYGIGWQATDCQEWADDTVSDCQRKCEGKE